jgi:hypothetical protein
LSLRIGNATRRSCILPELNRCKRERERERERESEKVRKWEREEVFEGMI